MPVNDLTGTVAAGKLNLESAAGRQKRTADATDSNNPFVGLTTRQACDEVETIAGLNAKTTKLFKFLIRENADLKRRIARLEK